MRDVTGQAHRRLMVAAESFGTYLSDRGYDAIDTPLLEEAELFVRKSGGELTSQLYTFTDPGGHRVSLRPEFTSSVIRRFIQEGESTPTGVRWQYSGPVFRYDREEVGAHRQFTQVGAELIGAGGVEADAEVLTLAMEGLRKTGLRDYQVRVGHLGVLQDMLTNFGLSEPAKLFIIGNVPALKNGSTNVAGLTQQAKDVGLLGSDLEFAADLDLPSDGGEVTRELIQRVLTAAASSPVGRRTTGQIVERLMRKVRVADSSEKLEAALGLVGEVAGAPGDTAAVLEGARGLAATHGLLTSALDELERLLDALVDGGIAGSQLVLDLGLARGISYYTGVIFDIYAGQSERVKLGGGGRYDGLVKALGGEDVPALGFAFHLEQVVDALEREGYVGTLASVTHSNSKDRDASSRRS